MMSYIGNHYESGESKLKIYFNMTRDGRNWFPVNQTHPVMYLGGISEVGFTFVNGNMFAVGRNEDGDSSGFGHRVFRADSGKLGTWRTSPNDPMIYESPRMFSYDGKAYLVARKDLAPPFDKQLTFLPFFAQKIINLVWYSLRAHTTALYEVNPVTNEVKEVTELPGCGDTAFPSIVQISPKKFAIINYSSPLHHRDWSWIQGQLSPEGTQIHYLELDFE
jgi:hypothetical protein